ncbi:hypothetical protein [Bradyrhizobium sp. SZCCHNR2012]|uniref:ORC-CDC6 family AAA ATPase n=1 Tax=Bradyrhizobium sp. SZCCHNR2012 TaxID=3057377 RepID=UPI0028EA7704|nr:hypothetical protein [Bradyrhizobium sp. SZCCHNR2012]
MPSYCCFFCPAATYNDNTLADPCPTCSRPFGFPLTSAPAEIGPFKILRPLGRGFYAATYVAERKTGLRNRSVLKATPKSFYEFFPGKNFEQECLLHRDVAEGTEHLVKIRDMLPDVDVLFGDRSLPCCVAELDFVDGPLLTDYFDGGQTVTAAIAAQMAIDLLRLREELERKQVFHNDLHAGNIIVERLRKDSFRADAVDPSIRAVAIDLGSAAVETKSDPAKQREGDISRIAEHIARLSARLMANPDQVSDHDFRLASTLQDIFQVLAAPAENTRFPPAQDLIRQVRLAYEMIPRHSWRSWRQPLALTSFGSAYNALTLEPWHVPALLIDPEGTWLKQISTPGPQIITGMRGCGKTMLLRALQFHARASQARGESADAVVGRIGNDGYMGLFVSAQRLIDRREPGQTVNADPFARLILAYAVEAVRSIMHLRDIDAGSVNEHIHKVIGRALTDILTNSGELANAIDLDDFDARLRKALVQHSQLGNTLRLQVNPSDAFIHLAESIRVCSPYWMAGRVLFLLDDVSTRYLKGGPIRELLSALLFQHPVCAFKITSEVQTMELELKTPGENFPAREGRDYSVFDLGSEVYDKIKGPQGKQFVERILAQRAEHFSAHPRAAPSQLLGDENMETIAREIAETASTSGKRKEVYRGITALAHVCVGDIGDVISLYERIIKAANGRIPVPPQVQCDCFQDHCSHRLYDLNRRRSELKDVARSFAEASYELLLKSFKEAKKNGKTAPRLRQYSSIYVRVTTGDTGKQMAQLRDLIDAGVFVFTGGSPRTKTKDSDPILQFKLTFRRIYGLTNFIGLAERDRFELSGANLEEWLANPAAGKEILMRNLGGPLTEEEEAEADQPAIEPTVASVSAKTTMDLFENLPQTQPPAPTAPEESPPNLDRLPTQSINVRMLSGRDAAAAKPAQIVIGLGFEDRTLASVLALTKALPPTKVLAIQYEDAGRSKEILGTLESWGAEIELIAYRTAIAEGLPLANEPTLIDVTGLAKPVIFHAVRHGLQKSGAVLVAHTQAKSYYPTDRDMKALLKAEEEHNRQKFFDNLSGILTGEIGPYECLPLLQADADETRRNVLFAFASPKHERLLSLIDNHVIDRLEVVAPEGTTPRNRVAKQIAEIAATDSASSEVTYINSDDLEKATEFLLRGFNKWYVRQGFNFEVGLTGSKMEAVASAAVSSVCKITQCWYVRPARFDAARFTKGAGETRYFRLDRSDV